MEAKNLNDKQWKEKWRNTSYAMRAIDYSTRNIDYSNRKSKEYDTDEIQFAKDHSFKEYKDKYNKSKATYIRYRKM